MMRRRQASLTSRGSRAPLLPGCHAHALRGHASAARTSSTSSQREGQPMAWVFGTGPGLACGRCFKLPATCLYRAACPHGGS